MLRGTRKVMDNLLIKTEIKVAREESAERKRSWRTERFAASTPSARSLATRPAHTAFQFKQGKKVLCLRCLQMDLRVKAGTEPPQAAAAHGVGQTPFQMPCMHLHGH